MKLALATSSRRSKIEMVMRRINVLEHFDALVTSDELNNSKPSPDIYLLAAKKLGIHPDRCIGK